MEAENRRFIKNTKELWSMLVFHSRLTELGRTSTGAFYYDTSNLEEDYIVYLLDGMDRETFWTLWQQDLRTLSIWNQGETCSCGTPLRHSDLHHAIVSKQDVRGIKDPLKKGQILHHSFNVVLVCKDHHEQETRQRNWDYLCGIYGKDEMIDWYYNLPLKALRRFE